MAQVKVRGNDSNFITYERIATQTIKVYDHILYNGNVYLHDDWKRAEFTLADGNKITMDSIKLNLFRGKVNTSENGQYMELKGSQFDSFRFIGSDDRAVYKSKHYYFVDGVRIPGIIKELNVDDQYNVLVAYKPELRKKSQDNPLMLDKLKKDVVRITKLKYIEKDGELIRIKNKKDLLNFFKGAKDVKKYMSKNKINPKNEEDIVKVLLHKLPH